MKAPILSFLLLGATALAHAQASATASSPFSPPVQSSTPAATQAPTPQPRRLPPFARGTPPPGGVVSEAATSSNAAPPPAAGAAYPLPGRPLPAAPAGGSTRNPLKPPVVVAPAPHPGTLLPNGSTQMPGMPMPGVPSTSAPGRVLEPLPGGSVASDINPIKAMGKRLGTVNGKAIFKQEEAYYFDTKIEKHQK